MQFSRSSGTLLHPTSLPGPYGVGDLGREAYRFVDFLHASRQKLWQVLPLNPTGYGDSPFQCFSAVAGNPLLLGLDELMKRGVLHYEDLGNVPTFPDDRVDFGRVIAWKFPVLRKAARNFFDVAKPEQRKEFTDFCDNNAHWLDDFALFMALKEAHQQIAWTRWPGEVAQRRPEALARWRERLAPQIETNKYWQFEFFREWQALRTYAHERGVHIIGDIPIYVAHDSADVWANPQFFLLDADGNAQKVSGVPPDYFSATGQLWGNPIYNWPLLKETGYRWWVDRFRAALTLYDIVRIDHFRGFEAYWEVPGGEKTAINGRWVKGPGAELFRVLQSEIGELPIIAENLGVITPEVEAIRHEFGFPGMAILQFAFGNDPQGPSFRPHNYPREIVAYTGTHDNDTTLGWWNSTGSSDSIRTLDDVAKEHAFARAYLNFQDEPVNWVLSRAVLASVANTAVVPMQDLLGLGNEARMNLPGTSSGNWRWRMLPGVLTLKLSAKLQELNALYDR
ncbi:MAG TPA: 4-alpha-glucanotransferase [Terriglobales bacterium]|nr:4-alpha-glucanotransferase [Terriglobales bacterium]